MKSKIVGSFGWPSLACALVLVSPFVSLIKHENYGFFSIEALAVMAVLALLGATIGLLGSIRNRVVSASIAAIVIVLFIDVQFDWVRAWDAFVWVPLILTFGAAWCFGRNAWPILSAVFATIALSSALIPDTSTPTDYSLGARATPANRDLPILVHLILDEHAGIDAIPAEIEGGPELKAYIRRFYLQHGFALFGRAYSQYIDSVDSISHLMNFASTPTDDLVEMTWLREGGQGFHWRMQQNEYFAKLARDGYRLRVHQSRFLDTCSKIRGLAGRCKTHPIGIGALRYSKAPRSLRIYVMASTILSRSFIYGQMRSSYNRLARSETGQRLGLATWSWERERVGPISAEAIFAHIEKDVADAEPGDAIVAHLLMPHDPYTYTANCQLRSPETWLGRSMFNKYTKITPASRALHYERYIAQMHCLYRRLDSLMETVQRSRYSRRFVIVLHGDHGARLGLRYPTRGSGSAMRAVDYRDNYATLFAIKSQGVEATYRSDVRSIQELFGTFLRNDFDPSALDLQTSGLPYVYITSRNRALFPIERCVMRGFATDRHAGKAAPSGPQSGAETVGAESAPAGPNGHCQSMPLWQAAGTYGAGHKRGDRTPSTSIETAGR